MVVLTMWTGGGTDQRSTFVTVDILLKHGDLDFNIFGVIKD